MTGGDNTPLPKIKAMKVDKYLKSHKANEFYVKKCRGYYLVMDNYDKSLASMEVTEEEAKNVAEQLNKIRNERLNLTVK